MSAPGPLRRRTEGARDDWATPWDVFEALDREFRFTLDPCASPENRKCERYLTEEEDGLAADWLEHTAFVNPPYSEVDRWRAKCARAAMMGATVVALVPNNTDCVWFRSAWETAHEIRFVNRRIPFLRDGKKANGNTGGSIVIVWRPGLRPYAAPVVSTWGWR